MTTELSAVGKFQKAIWTIDSYFSGFGRNNFNAETPGLDHCSSCQIGAGQSARKAEIVFNTARHTGRTTRRFAFDHDCSQSLARAIHRGCEPGWTTADNREIVERFRSASLESRVFG